MGYGARSMPEIFVSMLAGLESAASSDLNGSPITLTPPNAQARVLVIGAQFISNGLGNQTATFASTGRPSTVITLPQAAPIGIPYPVYRGAPGQPVTITGSTASSSGSVSYCYID